MRGYLLLISFVFSACMPKSIIATGDNYECPEVLIDVKNRLEDGTLCRMNQVQVPLNASWPIGK